MRLNRLLALLVLSPSLLLASEASAAHPPAYCAAQITAALPGVADSYSVDFGLALDSTGGALRIALVNGSDRIDFSSASFAAPDLSLRLDQYDATLTAHCVDTACHQLEGEYVRQKGSVVARFHLTARCSALPPAVPATLPASALGGDWQFTFTNADGSPASEPTAPGRLSAAGSALEGTVAPTSGDYGLLAGSLAADQSLLLSRFDGIHLLRLEGRATGPDRIEGVFHVAPGMPLRFVATRATTAADFEEAEHSTSVVNPAEPFHFGGADESGRMISEADPRFRGKVVVLDLFGTWCPNCHDEAPLLAELYAKYHARGLEIAGLSYEYVDDAARSQRLLAVYRRKYGITFPLLLAGTTDRGEIARSLPQLRDFSAYPTTIFLDRHGRVRLIHTGFSGPATGRLEALHHRFEEQVERLLAEP